MKNLKFLFLGTSLSCFPALALGQCVVTEDCAALGYTASSCDGGKGVKCPFGNGWFCGGDEATVCAENGFKYVCIGTGYSGGSGQPCGGKYKTCNCATNYTWNGNSCVLSCSSSYKYTCSGTGYAGGAGSACGGKYTQCTCASGYEWKGGRCQKQILNGAQGDLYYCNGKVVGVKTSGMDFYVAMKDLGSMNWDRANSSCQNYSFCGNLKGTLPTLDQLKTMYNNKSSLNSLLSTNGGTKLTEGWYWSSTNTGNGDHDLVGISNGFHGWSGDDSYYYVRPVLTKW